MEKKTILNRNHRKMDARMVPFGGWDMPVHYGSQIDEHHAVRRAAGMFDVSHMVVVDLTGERVRDYLRKLLANDVSKLKDSGKALYSCMLNEDGGVIDDLICYFMDGEWFRMVVNAATRDKGLAWLERQGAEFHRRVRDGFLAEARRDPQRYVVIDGFVRVQSLPGVNDPRQMVKLPRIIRAGAVSNGSA